LGDLRNFPAMGTSQKFSALKTKAPSISYMKPKMINQEIKPWKVNYDKARFNFRKLVADQLQTEDLENLHQNQESSSELLVRAKDQSTIWHKRYYQIGPHFFDLYEAFVREVVMPLFGEPIVFQKIPTFRVQYHNNVGVGEFHRDRDYAHNLNEINFWLPVTRTFATNTIWIESEEGKEDFAPIECEIGEVAVFNGCHLKHGNKINDTGQTRVSFDFRAFPYSVYSEENVGRSINMKTEFKIGGYYKLMSK